MCLLAMFIIILNVQNTKWNQNAGWKIFRKKLRLLNLKTISLNLVIMILLQVLWIVVYSIIQMNMMDLMPELDRCPQCQTCSFVTPHRLVWFRFCYLLCTISSSWQRLKNKYANACLRKNETFCSTLQILKTLDFFN